jgi:hypothetical protein
MFVFEHFCLHYTGTLSEVACSNVETPNMNEYRDMRYYSSELLRRVEFSLKMKTVRFSETLVYTYNSTRRHSPKEQHRQ